MDFVEKISGISRVTENTQSATQANFSRGFYLQITQKPREFLTRFHVAATQHLRRHEN
jgi:hypothetical protein